MKNRLHSIKNRLYTDRLFLRHFFQLFIAMAIIFALFTMFTYRNSRQILEREFTDVGMQDLKNISGYVEDLITETKDMIATLVINPTLNFFYGSPSPENVWINYSSQVKSQLTALCYSRECIEEIYLYSECSDTLYSSVAHYTREGFSDKYWLEQMEPDQSGFSVFPYAMNTRYPRVICVAKAFTVGDNRCAIAIMLNLSKLSIIASTNENSYQSIYLVSDDSRIIYRHRQEKLKEPLDTTEYLMHFDPDVPEKVCISSDDADTYSYAQLHSADYPWGYVLITHLQNYTSSLSAQKALLFAISCALIMFAVLFAFVYAMRSLKPIHNLRDLLDSPELLSSETANDSTDIKYIAGRITQYIQTSRELREALNDRLHLLNETQIAALQSQINPHFLFNTLNMMYVQSTDSLGYDHALVQMILDTSTLIRYAMNPEKMVSLKTELSYTDIYLSILNQRYDNELKIIRDISPDALTAQVPRLFIQPIIENAIFHGFSNQRDKECILSIQCYREDGDPKREEQVTKTFLIMKISDNGKGISAQKLEQLRESLKFDAIKSSKNIGLRNVVQRMNLLYSDRFELNIESVVEKGTCFSLKFPYVG